MRHRVIIAGLIGAVIVGVTAGWLASGKASVNGVSVCDNLSSELKSKAIESGNTIFEDKDLENRCINYSYDLDFLDDMSFMDGVLRRNYEVVPVRTLNKGVLLDYISSYNKDKKKPVNASVKRDGRKFKVVGGVSGTKVDSTSVLIEVQKRLSDSSYVPIKLSDWVKEPSVTKSDLQGVANKANKYLDWSCKYKKGVMIKPDKSSVKVIRNKVVLDDSFISNQLISVSSEYNSVGSGVKFKTHSGTKRTISGGTWGRLVDTVKEYEFLKDSFKSGKSCKNRTPEFSVNYTKIGKTYVEVSLSAQHVWVYVNGKLKMDSSCVTGDTSKGHGTPSGVYYISECIPGKYLVGDGYKTWVNRWMRLTNMGVGLHDATWRSSFGGSIYTYNGSHGCINLPYSFAKELYELAYVGMPCIVY